MNINEYLLKSLPIFFLVLPISLIVGPAALNINIAILSLLFVITSIINFKVISFKIRNHNKAIIFFIIFYLYILLLSLLNQYPNLSIKSSFLFIKIILILGVLNTLIKKKLIKFELIGLFFFITFTFVIFDALFQILFGFNILLYIPNGNQITGIFNDEQILGSYISRLIPIVLAALIC